MFVTPVFQLSLLMIGKERNSKAVGLLTSVPHNLSSDASEVNFIFDSFVVDIERQLKFLIIVIDVIHYTAYHHYC